MVGDRERALAAGMDDYLSKPYTRSQLIGMLERRIAKQSNSGTEVDSRPDDMSCESRLDTDAIENIRKLQQPGKPDLLNRIIGHYLRTTPAQIRDLQRDIEDQQAKAVRTTSS